MSMISEKQNIRNAPPHQMLLPDGWPRPKGYTNAIIAKGIPVFLGGQIGWNEKGEFPDDFVAQVRQALLNISRLLTEAGTEPSSLVRMVWYVTDMSAYTAHMREIGVAYREVFGYFYPTMTLVQVVSLVEPKAMVEIEATAVIAQ
jgi:enamine deaminase RidA (YjgF/YER057c/UK114 family)